MSENKFKRRAAAAVAEFAEKPLQEPQKETPPQEPVIERPNFSNLPEPERTFSRLDYVLKCKELTNAFRVAAALIVKEFYQNDTNRIEQMNVSEILFGFPSRVRVETIKALENIGLIERSNNAYKKNGCNIVLKF